MSADDPEHEWHTTRDLRVDYAPECETDEYLDHLCTLNQSTRKTKGKDSSITYVLGPEEPYWPKEWRVKVYVKKEPTNSKMGVTRGDEEYKKTTLVKVFGERHWQVLEYRVEASEYADIDPKKVEWLISFLQPPRWYTEVRSGSWTDAAFQS